MTRFGTSQGRESVLPPLPELRSTTVFGRKICYYDVGSGPVLLLVHGIGGDADQWVFCFEALAARYRVIALDLMGFGRSDKPLIDYRIAGFVEGLEQFLRTLFIKSACLLGHSLGGWIVAAFALKFPERVEKLILNDATGIDFGAIPLAIDLHVSTHEHVREVLNFMFYDKSIVSDELVDLVYCLHLERGDGLTIRSVLETINAPGEKLDGKLAELKAPTLILWGQEDALAPLSLAQSFRQLIRGSRLEVIPHCGHIPPLEKPAEFVQQVLQFLG